MTSRIFISYRRSDTAGYAHLIYTLLEPEFGAENVFMDVDTIEPGQDFVETLNRAVGICDVLLVLIGPSWLNTPDERGARRLDDPNDFVRLEIASALNQNKTIIPVLIQGAGMPPEAELPGDISPLSRRQAVKIGDHVAEDVKRLAASIRRAVQDYTLGEAVSRSGPREGRGKSFTTGKTRPQKSNRNLIILSGIVIGVCLVLATTLAILFGPRIVDYVSGGKATATSLVRASTLEAVTDLPGTTVTETASDVPRASKTEPATDAPVAATTQAVSAAATQPKPPTSPPPAANEPERGFRDNCIRSAAWTFFPNSPPAASSNGCLSISNMGFSAQDQALSINVPNPAGNNRYGIYSPLNGDAEIGFDLRIDQLTTQGDNELVSLGFGLISTSPLDAETDGFIFYVIESNASGYPVFLKKAERGMSGAEAWEQYITVGGEYYRYKLGTNQRVSFLLAGNQLSVSIDGKFIRSTNLAFGERAFFIGYKFENRGSLNAKVSNLSVVEK